MKQFITWKCDICDALFEFDADLLPLRCPDCFSTHEHLSQAYNDPSESDPEVEVEDE